MKWLKCQVNTTKAAVDAISHILEQFKIQGIEIRALNKEKKSTTSHEDDVQIIFYIKKIEKNYLQQIKQQITDLYNNYSIPIGSAKLSTESLSDDWQTAWKKYYEPIRISKQMMIVPTWQRSAIEDFNHTIIELDPGLAFGTGSHPSTILSLQALEKYVQKNKTIIDVGSGSGILSIAAVRLGAKEVIAIDNDQQAIKSTKQNAHLNDVHDTIIAIEGDLLKDVKSKADLIVTNILAEVIITFVTDAYERLYDNGYFITSGIIKRKQSLVKEALEKASFTIVDTISLDEWVCIVAQKQIK